jgi:GT2 family glycosyltransferase
MNYPLVSLMVLNWNGADMLEECIDSLKRLEYPGKDIIVIDNASSDSSIGILDSMEGVTVVRNPRNLGYAGGNNAGFRLAKGTYIATINNDIIVEPSWLTRLVTIIDGDETIGIISGRQMNYFDRDIVDSLYSYLHPSMIFFPEAFGRRFDRAGLPPGPLRVLGVSGASTLYRKRMIEDLCGFDETLFAYHEESDLCMRAFLSGWKCVFVPSAVVYHRRSVSFNRIKGVMFFYQTRNRLWFIYKYSPASLFIKNLFWIMFTELRILRIVIFRERVLLQYFKGLVAGIKGIPAFSAVRRSNMIRLRNKRMEYAFLRKRKAVPF